MNGPRQSSKKRRATSSGFGERDTETTAFIPWQTAGRDTLRRIERRDPNLLAQYPGLENVSVPRDLAALTEHLNLKKAVHVGHSTGGGEVAHYIARHGASRVAKAVLISAVPPLMLKTPANPAGSDFL